MDSRVHSAAHVDDEAVLAPGVQVGPGAVIEAGVRVGALTVIEAGTVLHRGCDIGARCRLGPYAVVGGVPMDTRFSGEASGVVIEDEVQLREFATVHRATGDGAVTRVGRGTLVMSYAHVSHNVDVGRGCVLTTHVQLGGHATVGDGAVLGATALVHQHCRVGRLAMFGAGSATNTDVLPFAMARGNPARHYRLNRVGLERHGLARAALEALQRGLRAVRRRDWEALDELAREHPEVAELRDFVRASTRGVARFVTGA